LNFSATFPKGKIQSKFEVRPSSEHSEQSRYRIKGQFLFIQAEGSSS